MKLILTAATAAAALIGSASAQQAYGNLGVATFDSIDDIAINGRLGYDFNAFVAAEGEATYFFNDEKVGAFVAYAKGQYPVGQQFSVHGRVGYGVINSFEFDVDDGTFAYGVGGEMALDARSGVRFDYTRFDSDVGDDGVFSIDYVFKFGAR